MNPTRSILLVALILPLGGCIDSNGGNAAATASVDTLDGEGVLPWADGDFDTTGPFSRVLNRGPHGILPDEVVHLDSELDGATIQIGIVRPDMPAGTRVPVLVMSTQYFRDLDTTPLVDACRTSEPAGSLGGSSGGPCRFDVHFLVENFVPHGYAVALVPVRGTSGSGGCYDVFAPEVAADLDQAVTWLATREWANGDAGMVGISTGGWTQFMVAGAGNPHLRTIVPLAAPPSLHTAYVRNGTTTLVTTNAAFYASYGLGVQQTREPTELPGAVCPDHQIRVQAALTWLNVDPYADPTGYWADADLREAVAANFDGSILYVHGFADDQFHAATAKPWIDHLRAGGRLVHELWGNWGHVPPDGGQHSRGPNALPNPTIRWDWAEQLLRWFDHELKGLDVAMGPAVQVADNTGRWHVEEAWPPADTGPFTLDLTDFTPAGVVESTGAPATNWGHATLQKRGARFLAPGLEEDLRISGSPRLTIGVTPTGAGGELAVFLRDATADEDLGWGVLDLHYRDGGTGSQNVLPGQRLDVKVELIPLDAFVPAGHEIELVIDASAPAEPGPTAWTPTVLHQEGELALPMVHRGAGAFIEPPTGPPEGA